MKPQLKQIHDDGLMFCSSKDGGRWLALPHPSSYQWWYFDAVSDSGTEAVSIRFYDNFLFSKDYWKEGRTEKTPAIKFSYLNTNGKNYSVTKRFSADRFNASTEQPECTIGDCSFYFNNADYGSGYYLKLDIDLPGGKKLVGGMEWLLIESDLKDLEQANTVGHSWNVVGLRADVSGRFKIVDRKGNCTENIHFRGTGYHDIKSDDNCLAARVDEMHWGRVHFADSTAIFHRHKPASSELFDEQPARLLIYKNGILRELKAELEEQTKDAGFLRKRLPSRVKLVTDENIRLRIKPMAVIHRDVLETSWLTEMTLTLRDGIPRRSFGLSEFSKPGNFNRKLYKWLTKLI